MTFYVEPTEVSLKKEIIIEAKIEINKEGYHSLMIASFMVEIDDSKRNIDEIFLQALDFILPQIYLFIQIVSDCGKKQESIFYS